MAVNQSNPQGRLPLKKAREKLLVKTQIRVRSEKMAEKKYDAVALTLVVIVFAAIIVLIMIYG